MCREPVVTASMANIGVLVIICSQFYDTRYTIILALFLGYSESHFSFPCSLETRLGIIFATLLPSTLSLYSFSFICFFSYI